jgi:signal transduction histidine kinase
MSAKDMLAKMAAGTPGEATGANEAGLDPPTGLLAMARRIPWWVSDGALALLLLGGAAMQLSEAYAGPRPFIRGGAAALIQHALVLLPLILRRRFPFPVLLLVAAASAAGPFLDIRDTSAQAAGITLAGYSIVAHGSRAQSLAGGLIVVGVYWLHINPTIAPWPIVWFNFAFLGLILYAGYVQNSRLRVAAALRGRRRELEEQGERAARRALFDERSRIAGDLHSVVAQSVRRMVEAAAAASRTRTANIADLAQGIESHGRAALLEMRRLLGVLRRATPGPNGEPSSPGPEALESQGDDGDQGFEDDPGAAEEMAAEARSSAAAALPGLLGFVVDAVIAAVLVVAVLGELDLYPPPLFGPYRFEVYLGSLLIVAAVLLRRLLPLPVVLAQAAGAFWLRSLGVPFPFAAGTAILVSLYAVGARRGVGEWILGAAAATAASASRLLASDAVLADLGPLVGVWVSIWWAPWIGFTARRTDELNAELARTNVEIERGRREEVRAVVRRERARIAREMHDSVAHGVSLMTIQAGAARSVAAKDRNAAKKALQEVTASGQAALEEMQEILGHLRGAGADEAGDVKGLDDLPELMAQASKVQVDLRVEGDARRIGDSLELSAYKIVRESLTNVRKHSEGSNAVVTVRYGDEALEVEVVDDGGATGIEVPGGGFGLVGMRERAAVFGGELEAGPRPGGGFRVLARLPVEVA